MLPGPTNVPERVTRAMFTHMINHRSKDFAFAMTNYGGLILTDQAGKINEWDTNEGRWLSQNVLFTDWFEKILNEGNATIEV